MLTTVSYWLIVNSSHDHVFLSFNLLYWVAHSASYLSRIIFSIWSSQKILHGDSCFIVNLLFHYKLGWKTFEHIFDYGTCKMKPSSIFWKLNTFVMLSNQERIPHCNSSHSHVLSLVVLSIVADFIPLICFKDR